MNLREYLISTGESVVAFARRISVQSRNSMYRYLRGDQIPRPEIMIRIYAATNGQVTPNDFYDLPELNGPEFPGGAAARPSVPSPVAGVRPALAVLTDGGQREHIAQAGQSDIRTDQDGAAA